MSEFVPPLANAESLSAPLDGESLRGPESPVAAAHRELYELWQRQTCGGQELEVQKAELADIIAETCAGSDADMAKKLKFAEPIVAYGLFAEPHQELPPGLAYYKAGKLVSVTRASEQAGWAYSDAMEILESNPRMVELVAERSGWGLALEAPLRTIVEHSPEYLDMLSVVQPAMPTAQERPLSLAQKQIVAARIENQLLSAAAPHVPHRLPTQEGMGQHPELKHLYARQTAPIDDMTTRQKQQRERQDPTERLKRMVLEACNDNKPWISGDGVSDAWTLEDITGDDHGAVGHWRTKDGSLKRVKLRAYGAYLANYLGRRDQTTAAMVAYSDGWEALVSRLFSSDKPSPDELVEVWCERAVKQFQQMLGGPPVWTVVDSPHFDRIAILQGNAPPKGVVQDQQRREEKERLEQQKKDTSLRVNFTLRDMLVQDTREAWGDVAYQRLQPEQHARLIVPGLLRYDYPHLDDKNGDLFLRTVDLSPPDIMGYQMRGKYLESFVYDYDPANDPYLLPPEEEMPIDRRLVADLIGDRGLKAMAQDIKHYSGIKTIADWTGYLRNEAVYYTPIDPQEAEERTRAFESGDWTALLNEYDEVLLQCDTASVVAGVAIMAAGYEVQVPTGKVLPTVDGIVPQMAHTQIAVEIDGTCLFDAQPLRDATVVRPNTRWTSALRRRLFGGSAKAPRRITSHQSPEKIPDSTDYSLIDSAVPDVLSAALEATTPQAASAKQILQTLEEQLIRAFNVVSHRNLYDRIGQLVPPSARTNDPLWRGLSLLRTLQSDSGDVAAVTADQLLAEATYAESILAAKEPFLRKYGITRPQPAMVRMLAVALRTTSQTLKSDVEDGLL